MAKLPVSFRLLQKNFGLEVLTVRIALFVRSPSVYLDGYLGLGILDGKKLQFFKAQLEALGENPDTAETIHQFPIRIFPRKPCPTTCLKNDFR